MHERALLVAFTPRYSNPASRDGPERQNKLSCKTIGGADPRSHHRRTNQKNDWTGAKTVTPDGPVHLQRIERSTANFRRSAGAPVEMPGYPT